MRIGELEDSLGREFAARRDTMTAAVARLGERLAQAVIPATPPAVNLPDSVRISPEARAAQFAKSAAPALPPFPSPVELVAALRELTTAPTSTATAAATKHLGELVLRLAQSFPAPAPRPVMTDADVLADRLVRSLLLNAAGATPAPADPEHPANLVRQLLAALRSLPRGGEGASLPAPTTFERASVAILAALTRLSPELSGQPGARMAAPDQSPFPAALLGLLAEPARQPRPRSRPRKRSEKLAPDEPDPETEQLDTLPWLSPLHQMERGRG